jgi:hypothetical protein
MEYINVLGMIVNQVKTTRLILLLAFSAFGCSSSLKVPDDMQPWELYIAMPSFYTVKVLELYGVNNTEDWTRPTHGYGLARNRAELSNVKRGLPITDDAGNDYDGLGIPLSLNANMPAVQIGGGVARPPESIYANWVSLYDKKLYITKIDLPQKVIQYMYKKHMYTLKRANKGAKPQVCYQNSVTLGFLPNGHVKVWLTGCGKFTYIMDQAPDAMFDKPTISFDPEMYSESEAYLKKIAKEAGIITQPVPWDKVNKVYWMKASYDLENFEDVKQ